jgi:hypothetical protein
MAVHVNKLKVEILQHYHWYCIRSGSGPHWVVGHLAFFSWLNTLISKTLYHKYTSILEVYALRNLIRGVQPLFLTICPSIWANPQYGHFIVARDPKFARAVGSEWVALKSWKYLWNFIYHVWTCAIRNIAIVQALEYQIPWWPTFTQLESRVWSQKGKF